MAHKLPPFESDRPSANGPEVRLSAARVLAARMGSDCDTDEAHAEIARALQQDTAYEMAKYLDDRSGWIIDDSILEVLIEGSFHAVLTAHREAVATWVQSRNIEPQKAAGDTVTVAYRGAIIEGTVTSVNEMEATYTVNSAQLGHIRPGQTGAVGIIVPFEHIHSLIQAPEDFTLRAQALPLTA